MPVEIQSVKLKVGEREIELSLEEAKQMKARLDELFGLHSPPVFVPWVQPVLVQPWVQPVYPTCEPYRVTCGETTSGCHLTFTN